MNTEHISHVSPLFSFESSSEVFVHWELQMHQEVKQNQTLCHLFSQYKHLTDKHLSSTPVIEMDRPEDYPLFYCSSKECCAEAGSVQHQSDLEKSM